MDNMNRFIMPDCIIAMVIIIMLKTMMKVEDAKPDKTTEESTKDKSTVAKRIKTAVINSGSNEKTHMTLAERRMQRKNFGSLPNSGKDNK